MIEVPKSPESDVIHRTRYSTTPEDRLSESESELSVDDFRREFPGYSESLSRRLLSCPFRTGQNLIQLKASGFKISEEDPLIHAVIDVGDANAVAFYNGGNYALPVGAAGALPWPGGGAPPLFGGALPAGVAALPPSALGRFISTLPGVVNKSGTALTLFYFVNTEAVHSASFEIKAQPQFCRWSVITAARLGLPPSPSPVSFLQLERMDGVPQLLRGFCEM